MVTFLGLPQVITHPESDFRCRANFHWIWQNFFFKKIWHTFRPKILGQCLPISQNHMGLEISKRYSFYIFHQISPKVYEDIGYHGGYYPSLMCDSFSSVWGHSMHLFLMLSLSKDHCPPLPPAVFIHLEPHFRESMVTSGEYRLLLLLVVI